MQTCDDRQVKKDQARFVLEAVLVAGECCPYYRKVACREDGNVYQIGEEWRGEDLCKISNCTLSDGEAETEVRYEVCERECEAGYQYERSDSACCGTCEAKQCKMEDGRLLSPGQVLTEDSACNRTVTCKIKDGKPQIERSSVSCPALPADCPSSSIRLDAQGCCQECVVCRDGDQVQRYPGEVWRSDNCTTCTCQGET